MAFRFAVLLSLVAFASAAPQQQLLGSGGEYDPNPQYHYSYQVQDPLTGDSHGQSEARSGDTVQGSYSLAEPDGSIRTVNYAADPVTGFQAVVSKDIGGGVIGQPIVRSAPISRIGNPQTLYRPGYSAVSPGLYSSGFNAPYSPYAY